MRSAVRRARGADDAGNRQAPVGQEPDDVHVVLRLHGEHHGGAEIECSFLFADVRGSTTMAERMSSAEFRGLLDRFYALATTLVIDHDGSIDKFVGDELVAMYFPLLSGERHTDRAVGPRGPCSAQRDTRMPSGPGCHSGPACTPVRPGWVPSEPARGPI